MRGGNVGSLYFVIASFFGAEICDSEIKLLRVIMGVYLLIIFCEYANGGDIR
jgi:hypothetical protein